MTSKREQQLDNTATTLLVASDERTFNLRAESETAQIDTITINGETFTIDDILAGKALSSDYMYCNKTGRCLGKLSTDEISFNQTILTQSGVIPPNSETSITPQTDTAHACDNSTSQLLALAGCCSQAWIFTDSKRLQQLMSLDPHGYFVMSAARCISHRLNGDITQQIKFNNSKIKAFQILQFCSREQIIVANDKFRTLLGEIPISHKKFRWQFTMPHEFAMLLHEGKFHKSIKTTLINTLRNDRIYTIPQLLNAGQGKRASYGDMEMQGKTMRDTARTKAAKLSMSLGGYAFGDEDAHNLALLRGLGEMFNDKRHVVHDTNQGAVKKTITIPRPDKADQRLRDIEHKLRELEDKRVRANKTAPSGYTAEAFSKRTHRHNPVKLNIPAPTLSFDKVKK